MSYGMLHSGVPLTPFDRGDRKTGSPENRAEPESFGSAIFGFGPVGGCGGSGFCPKVSGGRVRVADVEGEAVP